jgi:hypothetical protein
MNANTKIEIYFWTCPGHLVLLHEMLPGTKKAQSIGGNVEK